MECRCSRNNLGRILQALASTLTLSRPVHRVIVLGLLGAVFPSIVGAIYYFATGEQPVAFKVLPG